VSKTNDEVICDFYRYIIELPEKDYYEICKCMREGEPIPGIAEKMICKANKKRIEVIDLDTNAQL
jgi:tyrosyl-tRNA synthetase